MTRGHLIDASTNRSRTAFDHNPSEDREQFPDAIDPLMTVLADRTRRWQSLVGVISWFPVHNTSMTNRSTLISSDNKGWAAYAWERDGEAAQTPQGRW